MIQGQHRVGLAAAEVGLQLDHRVSGLAIEAKQGDAQQILEATGDVGAAEELGRVGVFRAALALAHLVEVGGELGLLVATCDHIGVRGNHIAPGHQACLDLVLCGGLVADLVAGALGEHHLLELGAQVTDGFRLGHSVDTAAEANGGVEVAVGVV